MYSNSKLKKIKPASISHEKYQYWTHTCLIRCTNKSRQLLNPLLISVGLLFAMVGNEIGTLFSIRQNFHFYSISPITATDLGGEKKNQSYNEIIYFSILKIFGVSYSEILQLKTMCETRFCKNFFGLSYAFNNHFVTFFLTVITFLLAIFCCGPQNLNHLRIILHTQLIWNIS